MYGLAKKRIFYSAMIVVVGLLTINCCCSPAIAQKKSGSPNPPTSQLETESEQPVTSTPKRTGKPSVSSPQPKDSGSSDSQKQAIQRNKIVYLKGPDGKLVPVPADATLQEYLKWRQEQALKKETSKQRFSVTSVSLKGHVEQGGGFVQLDTILTVQLDRESEWVQVPLQLNEAILRDTSYTGKGEASFDRFDRTTGYSWWFKGQGIHTLNLSLLIPVRKQASMRRLQLRLPSTAVSSLKLDVPLPNITVKVTEQSPLKVTTSQAKTSIIEVFGLGSRLDLQWQSIPEQKQMQSVLQATTNILVVPAVNQVLMTTTQEIGVSQGSFESIKVNIPDGWDLIEIRGDEYASHEIIDGKIAKIQLEEKTAGPITLTWEFEAPFPEQEKLLSLSGFSVAGARRQRGTVAIRGLEGYRIIPKELRNARRTDVNLFSTQGEITTAYQFQTQPFQLKLAIEEIEPNFIVHPKFELQMSDQSLELAALYEVQVLRGTVGELQLTWPSRDVQNWQLESVTSVGNIAADKIKREKNQQEIIIPLLERKSGKFSVRLRAIRKISKKAEQLSVHLPVLQASSQFPAELLIKHTDNIETRLSSGEKTDLKLVEINEEAGQTQYQLESDSNSKEFALQGTMEVHEQAISAHVEESIELRRNNLLIAQRIRYRVQYEPVQQLRLLIPLTLKDQARIFLDDGTPLTSNATGLIQGDREQIRLALPKPKLGQFDIIVRYSHALSDETMEDGIRSVTLPLVLLSDAQFDFVQFQSRLPADYDIQFSDSAFQRQIAIDGTTEWNATKPIQNILFQIIPLQSLKSDRIRILQALIQTKTDNSGRVKGRAQYLIEGDLRSTTLLFGPEYQLDYCWLDDEIIAPKNITMVKPGNYRIQLGKQLSTQPRLLTIDYQLEIESQTLMQKSKQLVAPKIAGAVWLGETLWELSIPKDQHLFLFPQGFTPLFQWEQDGLIWRRKPFRDVSLENLFSENTLSPPPVEKWRYGNQYLFNRIGAPVVMSYYSMSRSFVVLFGAGLALITGFFLLKVPATRNLLTLLLAAFMISLISVWYWEPVQLLLQPALLGLVLAASAALIERMLERQRRKPILTISPPSDYIVPANAGSSVDQPAYSPMFGVGSDDPTMVRVPPAQTSGDDSISSSEVGSHT